MGRRGVINIIFLILTSPGDGGFPSVRFVVNFYSTFPRRSEKNGLRDICSFAGSVVVFII